MTIHAHIKHSLADPKNRLGKSDLWAVFKRCQGPGSRQMVWKMAFLQHDPNAAKMLKEMLSLGGNTFLEIKNSARRWIIPISGNERYWVWKYDPNPPHYFGYTIEPHIGQRLRGLQCYQAFGFHPPSHEGVAYITDKFTT